MSKSIEEKIVQTTMYIQGIKNGSVSSGTGFQLFVRIDAETIIPLLITNKHVVADNESIRVHFSLSDPSNYEKKVGVASYLITGDWSDLWVPHPDKSVDLGAIITTPIFQDLEKRGKAAYGQSFSENDILSQEDLSNLSPIEDILMVGYPIGLRDSVNNQPIVRRGTTATDPRINFQGKEEFLIDCACWPGSSGSPVLIKPQSLKSEGGSIYIRETNYALAGVLYAGPTHNARGSLKIEPIPTSIQASVNTPQMIHVGNIINSTRIHELATIVRNTPPRSPRIDLRPDFKIFS